MEEEVLFMEEIWKDIKGYEGLYQVSNLGRVRSVDRLDSANHKLKGRIKSTSIRPNGYENVILCKNSKSKGYSVHRLVAQAFILNPENKPQINHIDENKANNKVSNLEWVTRKENINHGNRTRTALIKMSKEVYCVETGKVYINARYASEELGVSRRSICDVCLGKQKQTKGYTFKYK